MVLRTAEKSRVEAHSESVTVENGYKYMYMNITPELCG